MALLGGLAAYVFLYLPERVEAPAPLARGEPASDVRSPGASGDVVAPFEAADSAHARKAAQAKLAEFFELKTQLEEQLNVGAWGGEDLDRITNRAKAADTMFVEERYGESLDEYAGAVGDLAALVDQGNAMYATAIANGEAALAGLDHATAVEAFERALLVRPGDANAKSGLERAAMVPELVDLLRQTDRAVLRGEFVAAHEFLNRVRTLDPTAPGLDERAAEIAATMAIERRKATLSEGFGALERDEHDRAVAAFKRVLENDPNDADAHAGLQQAERARLLAEVDRLRRQAERQESEGRFADALATYDAVLSIDRSLRFARDGKTRIANRVALVESMRAFIDDPGALSDDSEFSRAKGVLAEAAAVPGADPGFRARVDELRTIIEQSSVPVALVIDSDDETEITIQKVGPLGTFLRTELMLRPGRYVIVGSRDGYRDIRDEILLKAGSQPVDIRCTEPI